MYKLTFFFCWKALLLIITTFFLSKKIITTFLAISFILIIKMILQKDAHVYTYNNLNTTSMHDTQFIF